MQVCAVIKLHHLSMSAVVRTDSADYRQHYSASHCHVEFKLQDILIIIDKGTPEAAFKKEINIAFSRGNLTYIPVEVEVSNLQCKFHISPHLQFNLYFLFYRRKKVFMLEPHIQENLAKTEWCLELCAWTPVPY